MNKDELVLSYTRLSLEFSDPMASIKRQKEIKVKLNEIREQLGMEPLKKVDSEERGVRHGKEKNGRR